MSSSVEVMDQNNGFEFETFVKTTINASQIMMKDSNAVFEKVARIKSDGLGKLQESELSKKYTPIEFDNSIPEEKKIPLMLDWWKGTNDAIIEVKESKNSVLYSIEKSVIFIREGFDQILEWLNRRTIPVCIASGGLGDVVKGTVEKYCGVLENISYASNFFIYDENDIIVEFSKPMIHSNNKHIIDQCDTNFDSKRNNCLLIGDSIGDCCMADNLPIDNVLKIGFFNSVETCKLDNYLNNFDIVIKSGHTSKPILPFLSFLLDI